MTTSADVGARRYVAVLVAVTVLPLLGMAIFNGHMDPLAQFSDPDSPRPWTFEQHRLIKAHGIADTDARCIVLGSSRMEVGIDPACPLLADHGRAYNAAITDASIYEIGRMAEHALALHDRPRLIIGLDFYTFQIAVPLKADWSEERLAVDPFGRRQWLSRYADTGRLLWTQDVTRHAWQVRGLLGKDLLPGERHFRQSGHQNRVEGYVRQHRGCRGAFRHKELGEMINRGKQFFRSLQTPEQVSANWTDLDRLLATVAREGLEVDLILPPVHARFLELLDLMAGTINQVLLRVRQDPAWNGDPWVPTWGVASWKTRLVRQIANVQERYPKSRIRLWDFMTYNAYTSAGLVPAGTGEVMLFHWEPSHFRPVVGEAILTRITAGDDARDPLADFGVLLDGGNLERHLAVQAARRDAWRLDHPADRDDLINDWRLVCEDPQAAAATWAAR